MTDSQPSAARQMLCGLADKLVDLMPAITVAEATFGTTSGAPA